VTSRINLNYLNSSVQNSGPLLACIQRLALSRFPAIAIQADCLAPLGLGQFFRYRFVPVIMAKSEMYGRSVVTDDSAARQNKKAQSFSVIEPPLKNRGYEYFILRDARNSQECMVQVDWA